MQENEISMLENEISMQENGNLTPMRIPCLRLCKAQFLGRINHRNIIHAWIRNFAFRHIYAKSG